MEISPLREILLRESSPLATPPDCVGEKFSVSRVGLHDPLNDHQKPNHSTVYSLYFVLAFSAVLSSLRSVSQVWFEG